MKARRIAPHRDEFTVKHFAAIGRTEHELEFHCGQLGVHKRQDGKYYIIGNEQEVRDDDWIVQPPDEGPYVLSPKEFHAAFDLVREYVKWDPSHLFGHLSQCMHLVNEVERGSGKVTVHEMAWGLFRNGTIREFMRQPICLEFNQELAAPWKECDKCVDGKIRFTEDDYVKFREDAAYWAKVRTEKGEPAEKPEFWTHTFCKVCGGVGYVWRLNELATKEG